MSPGEIANAFAPQDEARLIPESRFRRLLKIGISTPVALMVLFVAIVSVQFYRIGVARSRAVALRDLLFEATDARTHVLEMETGFRGYLFSKTPDYKKDFEEAKSLLAADFSKLVVANPDRILSNTAVEVQGHVEAWEQIAESQLGFFDLGRKPSENDSQLSKQQLDRVTGAFNDYIALATRLYQDSSNSVVSLQTELGYFILIGVLVIAAAAILVVNWLLRSLAGMYHSALVAHEEQLENVRRITSRYQLVTDHSVDLISLLDADCRFTYASPSFERVLGSAPETIVGKYLVDCVVEEDKELVRKTLVSIGDAGSALVIAKFSKVPTGVRDIELTLTAVESNVVSVGRDVSERLAAENEVKKLYAELEQRVAERTDELEKANADLKVSGEELERANKELEAFSYSVSHDLRAPLRSIASFTMILQEDLEGKLDADSVDNLARIRAASVKMTNLIDALLKFSRIARAEVVRSTVNLSQQVETIVGELRRRDPERTVEVTIQPDLTEEADSQLLRVILENLLENSWKFTANNEKARIEFGKEDDHYFVRDNGAGFEQEYVDKVFLPFERLHTDREFPGTGIGLATTKRVIDRHGGRIWAFGEVGTGATFNFTLHA